MQLRLKAEQGETEDVIEIQHKDETSLIGCRVVHLHTYFWNIFGSPILGSICHSVLKT